MALSASEDFEGFDETLFWQYCADFSKQFPKSTLQLYPERFEDFLNDFPNRGNALKVYDVPERFKRP